MINKKLKEILFLLFVFVLTFILRTYRLDNPVADWHSWRQADTAAVARNFAREKFNIFYPQSHNFFKQNPNDLDNPNRYFLNEFPLYNAITAGVYKIFGINERFARLVSVFFSSLTGVFLYLLIKQYSSLTVSGLAAFFWAILPYNIYYGRVIMPDPLFIFFSVLALYSAGLWLEKETFLQGIFFSFNLALAMLVKPYAIFLGLPIAYLVFRKWGKKFYLKPQVFIFAFLALLPLILWRRHINLHPEGMFGSDWLINATNIRFKGAFFRWIIFERFNRLIFAGGGFVLFFFGLAHKRDKKEGLFFLFWLLSVLAYICYFAMGNVTHDYYQLPIVPIGCYFMAKGLSFLLENQKDIFTRLLNNGLALVLFIIMIAFGWYEVRGFFNVNRWEIVQAGQAVDKLTPPDAKVIAPYDRDPAFLYQTNRNGWSGLRNEVELEEFIKAGATHYVSVNFDDITNKLIQNCRILEKTDQYVIINLMNCEASDERL